MNGWQNINFRNVYLLHKIALNFTVCSDNPVSSYGERIVRVQESQALTRIIFGMQISCDVFRQISSIADYNFYRLAVKDNHREASSQSNLKYKQASIMQFVTFVSF